MTFQGQKIIRFSRTRLLVMTATFYLFMQNNKMNDGTCEVFEGYGSSTITNNCDQNQTIEEWTNVLVGAVFEDPDCEHLLVDSIITAIKDIGFPMRCASKIEHLEQHLDPKNEGIPVDRPTLKEAVRLWLMPSVEEDVEDSFVVNLNSTKDFKLKSLGSSYVDDTQKKDDNRKKELNNLHTTTLNEYEHEIKRLQLDNDVLKKSVKNLQAGLRKAEEDKALAEEINATIKETLKIEKSRRSTDVTAVTKKLALSNDLSERLTKENCDLYELNAHRSSRIENLQDELGIKCNELDKLVQENGLLKMSLERLKQAEKEICQLKNTNFELVEHGKEWKRTIQNLREEKDVLCKKLLVSSSRAKKGEKAGSSSSSLGSDSSNIGEVSIFSPLCFSSPLASEKLSLELADSACHETAAMESTNRIPRPENHLTKVTSILITEQKCMRKRKLFAIQTLDPDAKRWRSDNSEATSTVFSGCNLGSATAMLPLERSTSFAIHLTIHQKLFESLRQTLRIHPHLFGCLRDFIVLQAGNSISGTKLADTDMTSLFYEFSTTQLSTPFCGRKFLNVICEELPTQSSLSALQSCLFKESGFEQLNNVKASQHTQASTIILEFENNDSRKEVQPMHQLAIAEGRGIGFDSTNIETRGLHYKYSEKLIMPDNLQDLKGLVSEQETISPSINLERELSTMTSDRTEAVTNIFDVAGISNCVEPPNDNLECNKQTIVCVDIVANDISPRNTDLLCNNITDMVLNSSPSPISVITSPVLVTGFVNNDQLRADIGCLDADASAGEYDSTQSSSIEPSDESFFDCTPEVLKSSSVTDLITPGSLLTCNVGSPDEEDSSDPLVETQIPADLANRDDSLLRNPVKKYVPCRCLTFMVLLVLFLCFLFFLLFFGLIFFAKALLPEADYISLILALGGKYHRGDRYLY